MFLQKNTGFQIHIIKAPDGEFLCLLPMGTKGYDYERQKEIIYLRDAIATGYFEKGGSSYVFENGSFRSFISSD